MSMTKSKNILKLVFLTIIFQITQASDTISEKQIERFATAITQVSHYYIKPVSYEDLFNAAIRGMLTSLDPHSDYLSPKDIKELQASTTGEYAGIGIEIIPENGLIKVISPMRETPAAKAGIQAGDMIIKVDDKLIRDVSTDEAIRMIKGPAGSVVTITVIRENSSDSLVFKIKREIIALKSVQAKMYRDKILYASIDSFGDKTSQQLQNQIERIGKTKNIGGLIIDLRNNPGGTLTAAIETADLFLDRNSTMFNGLIVYTRGRLDIDNMEAYATPGDILQKKPIVVLINNGSASASEIVAGALRDQKRAVVMGTQSFGKGSVQTVIPIDYESAIKLTTSLYYTPNGTSIQANGIIPDVFAPYTKMPKQEQRNNIEKVFEELNESNLSGHLTANSNLNQDNTSKILARKEEQAKLAYDDFQLYQALNLVDAMIVRGLLNN
ncbi:MAG: S41 family peptidase [Pseudomonadota bacterium]|nr:S41 family peptidase [Pseudomonadota bacterium]